MIEMNFEPQVVEVLEAMPKDRLKPEGEDFIDNSEQLAALGLSRPKDFKNIYRTTFMFSATMPPEVERLSRSYLRRPVQIVVGVAGRAVDRIKQTVHFTHSDNEKRNRLEECLRYVSLSRLVC